MWERRGGFEINRWLFTFLLQKSSAICFNSIFLHMCTLCTFWVGVPVYLSFFLFTRAKGRKDWETETCAVRWHTQACSARRTGMQSFSPWSWGSGTCHLVFTRDCGLVGVGDSVSYILSPWMCFPGDSVACLRPKELGSLLLVTLLYFLFLVFYFHNHGSQVHNTFPL